MRRPETQYAACGDLNIAYQVIGDGPIDLLHAMGWLTNVEYAWESPELTRFLTRLSKFSRLIVFDKRGTGLSDRDVGVPTLEERAEDIKAVLDAVGSERAALLGTSEGGTIASMFAATYPERVSALILCGAYAKGGWAPDYPWGQTEEGVEEFIADLRANWGQPFELSEGAPSVARNPVVSAWFAAFLRQSASPNAAANFTRLGFKTDVTAALPAISAPTLVLHREGDRWVHVDEGRYLAARIPGACLRVLPGDDHIPFYGDQDQIIGEIQEFLTGARGVSAPTRALLTLVMTDIVESTQAVAEMGDERWRGVLEQLDAVVARRVPSYGGERVKHTGDGYLLSFSGPTRAIECARALTSDAERLGLRLRTGLHTGECERRGEDLSGVAVHLAARIMAEAKSGEVLTSGTVRDLVVGSDFQFDPQGARSLKGLQGQWEIFAISA